MKRPCAPRCLQPGVYVITPLPQAFKLLFVSCDAPEVLSHVHGASRRCPEQSEATRTRPPGQQTPSADDPCLSFSQSLLSYPVRPVGLYG